MIGLWIVAGVIVSGALSGAAAAYYRRQSNGASEAHVDEYAETAEIDGSKPCEREIASRSQGLRARDRLALDNVCERDPLRAREDLAQAQDQPPSPTTPASATPRGSPGVALADLHERDLVIWLGRHLDGGTSWRITAAAGFSLYDTLGRAIAAGRRAIELTDPGGGPVRVKLKRAGKRIEIHTAATRIDLQRDTAAIAVTSIALETEGVHSWYARELPRAVWWLLGVDVSRAVCPACVGRSCDRCDDGRRTWPSWRELAHELAALGVEQLGVEQALECDLEIEPGIEDQIVCDRLKVKGHRGRKPGTRAGIQIGTRTNPEQAAIYDKPGELAASRADRAALIDAMKAAGWQEGQRWTRVEARSQGDGLVLLQGGEVVVDGRHPGAALDELVTAALWRRVTGRIWLAAPGNCDRLRDNTIDPRWQQIQAAADQVLNESAQTTMISRAARTQLASVAESAARRLGQAGIDVGVIQGGGTLDEVAALARRELEAQLIPALARERLTAARARYQALLDAVEQTADPEHPTQDDDTGAGQ